MTLRSRMSSFMDLIGQEGSKLSALELERIAIFDCIYSIICNYRPVSTKLGHNIYDHKISHEFDFGSIWTRIIRVICL